MSCNTGPSPCHRLNSVLTLDVLLSFTAQETGTGQGWGVEGEIIRCILLPGSNLPPSPSHPQVLFQLPSSEGSRVPLTYVPRLQSEPCLCFFVLSPPASLTHVDYGARSSPRAEPSLSGVRALTSSPFAMAVIATLFDWLGRRDSKRTSLLQRCDTVSRS